MINREIIYERDMTGSYMKIPAGVDAGIDELLMLRRRLSGVLPVEKVYLDGGGQYWYHISGKQSLDTYCRVKEVNMDLIEQLIISICSLMERMEWNLMKTNCLMLDPELIFISNSNREFTFTLYPGGSNKIEQEFQQLIEYLMKKVNHQDAQAVRSVYRIYELTLEEGYLISDIWSTLVRQKNLEPTEESWAGKKSEKHIEEPRGMTLETFMDQTEEKPTRPTKEIKQAKKKVSSGRGKVPKSLVRKEKINFGDRIRKKLVEWGILQEIEQKQEKVVYPDEIIETKEEPMPVIHPTVCLINGHGQLRGQLLYIGSEGLCDIHLGEGTSHVGYGQDADICINRETISQIHARIEKTEDGFYIEDLNSTNGTFVNEEPLAYKEKRKLASNDIVQFADIRYRFC